MKTGSPGRACGNYVELCVAEDQQEEVGGGVCREADYLNSYHVSLPNAEPMIHQLM